AACAMSTTVLHVRQRKQLLDTPPRDGAHRRPMTARGIRVETKEQTRWLCLERPPRNLLDIELMTGLADELRECDAETSVGAVVLTGCGGTFCGGLDVAQIQAGADPVAFASALIALLRVL